MATTTVLPLPVLEMTYDTPKVILKYLQDQKLVPHDININELSDDKVSELVDNFLRKFMTKIYAFYIRKNNEDSKQNAIKSNL